MVTATVRGGEVGLLPIHATFLGVLVENHTRIPLADVKVFRKVVST